MDPLVYQYIGSLVLVLAEGNSLKTRTAMPCKSCGSVNQTHLEFAVDHVGADFDPLAGGLVAQFHVIHAPIDAGLIDGLDKPIVWVFLELVVCVDCGTAEFVVPEAELRVLAKGDAAAAQ